MIGPPAPRSPRGSWPEPIWMLIGRPESWIAAPRGSESGGLEGRAPPWEGEAAAGHLARPRPLDDEEFRAVDLLAVGRAVAQVRRQALRPELRRLVDVRVGRDDDGLFPSGDHE